MGKEEKVSTGKITKMMEIRFAFLATRLDFINNKKVFFEKPFQGLEKNTFLFSFLRVL